MAIDDHARKRIDKRVFKLWKIEDFELRKLPEISGSNFTGDFFQIKTGNEIHGILYPIRLLLDDVQLKR